MMSTTQKWRFQGDRKEILRDILHVPIVICLQMKNVAYALICFFVIAHGTYPCAWVYFNSSTPHSWRNNSAHCFISFTAFVFEMHHVVHFGALGLCLEMELLHSLPWNPAGQPGISSPVLSSPLCHGATCSPSSPGPRDLMHVLVPHWSLDGVSLFYRNPL